MVHYLFVYGVFQNALTSLESLNGVKINIKLEVIWKGAVFANLR